MKYLILAQYVKSGKKTWWISSVSYLWKKGTTQFVSGTTTEVKIIDIIEITEEQLNIYGDI